MLVLTRKPGEKLVIGHDIVVTVLEVRGNHVKIGIEAPDSVRIVRAELKAVQPEGQSQGESSDLDPWQAYQHRFPLAVC